MATGLIPQRQASSRPGGTCRGPGGTLSAFCAAQVRRMGGRLRGEPRGRLGRYGWELQGAPAAHPADLRRPRPGDDQPRRRPAVLGANSDLAPSSLGRYIVTLRQVLDFAEVEPNPARDKRVKLPRVESPEIEPPSGEQVEASSPTSRSVVVFRCGYSSRPGCGSVNSPSSSGGTSTSPAAASASVGARRPRAAAGWQCPPG